MLCCQFFCARSLETQLCLREALRGRKIFPYCTLCCRSADIINLFLLESRKVSLDILSLSLSRSLTSLRCWRCFYNIFKELLMVKSRKKRGKSTNWDDNSTNELNIKSFPPTQRWNVEEQLEQKKSMKLWERSLKTRRKR